MSAPYVVFSLPRSRSAWLATFLSPAPFRCGHDITIECKSIEDFTGAFGPRMQGSCETAACLAWPLLRARMPQASFVVVRRRLDDVMDSFARLSEDLELDLPLDDLEGEMTLRARALDELTEQPGTLSMPFDSLDREAVCANVFEHCLGVAHNHAWYAHVARHNIQIDFKARLLQIARNQEGLAGLRAQVAQAMESLRAT